MHGFGQMMAWAILIGAACAFVVGAFTGARTPVSAGWGVVILGIFAAALNYLASDTATTAMTALPMVLAMCVVGLVGALPGAALGRRARSQILKER